MTISHEKKNCKTHAATTRITRQGQVGGGQGGGILRWRRTRRRRNQSPPWLKKNSNQPQQPPQQLQPHPRAMPPQQGKLQHSCYNKSNNNHDTRTRWRRTRSRNSEIERRIRSPLVVQQQSTMTPAQRRQVVCTKDRRGR